SAAAAARRVAQRFPALGPPVEAAADDPALPAIPLAAGWPPGEVQGQGQGQDQGRGHDQGRAGARPAPHRRLAVVIPVHRGLEVTRDCLEAVLATVPRGCRVIVVDDATPEPALAALLDGLARRRRIRLLRNVANRGFPASANAGLRAAATLRGRPDVVLLNSDTRVTAGWIEGLRAVVQGGPDIGTATPLSNDATIMSYPASATAQPAPDAPAQAALARLVAAAAGGAVIDLPTAVGFCMYIRRECLLEVGLFREDVFAQGYGEENDFCLRARHLGWRHVGVPGIYVAHAGAQSFGPARAHLVARNLAVLERLHPGYAALIAAFEAADPLAAIRRRLDFARWRTGRRRAGAVILVTHDSGGGVERVVQARCATLRAAGRRAILLRPVKAREGAATYREGLCAVAEAGGPDYPDLRFAIPDEIPAMLRLLRGERATHMEVHHLLGHHHGLLDLAARLDIPVEQHVHDYALLCPRIALVGRDGRYCGEPEEVAACEACIADAGRKTEEEIGVAALRARSAADLAAARRVVVPSGDAAARLGRYFPGLRPDIAPLEAEAAPPARMAVPIPGARRLVCVIGAIGPEKGYDVLLACARDAAARDLPLGFTLVGHTPDDARLLATGRVFVTGPYREAEAVRLIAAQQAQLAFLPSIWPETWCFTLGLAWRAGLAVAAFDLGAPAERIRARGGGWLLPLGLPPAPINAALLAV
ncbi:MAG: glycosyltransferase, partial [Rhodospirillales bacterium]|nr:glycosyltransferase [Rhodospirillales bacterium]